MLGQSGRCWVQRSQQWARHPALCAWQTCGRTSPDESACEAHRRLQQSCGAPTKVPASNSRREKADNVPSEGASPRCLTRAAYHQNGSGRQRPQGSHRLLLKTTKGGLRPKPAYQRCRGLPQGGTETAQAVKTYRGGRHRPEKVSLREGDRSRRAEAGAVAVKPKPEQCRVKYLTGCHRRKRKTATARRPAGAQVQYSRLARETEKELKLGIEAQAAGASTEQPSCTRKKG